MKFHVLKMEFLGIHRISNYGRHSYIGFFVDSRNVMLVLSTDSFEPFKHGKKHNISQLHFLLINLHPWMSMKKHHLITLCGFWVSTTSMCTCIHLSIDKRIMNRGRQHIRRSYRHQVLYVCCIIMTASDFLAYTTGWLEHERQMACPYCKNEINNKSLYT